MSPPPAVALGVGLGLDVLNPTSRIIPASLSLEIFGVGLTAGFTLADVEVSRATVGEGFQSSGDAPPNLNTRFGSQHVWAPGVMLAVTLDADVFERLFRAYFGTSIPKIGGI